MRDQPLAALQPLAPPGFAGGWRKLGAWKHQVLPAVTVVALALAAAGVGIGLATHNHTVAQHRVALTEAFFRLYASPPVSESWVRLSRIWRAHEPELRPLLNRIENASGATLEHQALAWSYQVNRIIEEEELARDIDVVFRFFKGVAQCVRVGHCDETMTTDYFGRDPWAFRNMHHPFLETAYPTEDFDAYFERIAPRRATG